MIRHTLNVEALTVDTFATAPEGGSGTLPGYDTLGDCGGAFLMMPHSAHTHVCDPCCNGE